MSRIRERKEYCERKSFLDQEIMAGSDSHIPSMSLPVLTEKNWDRWSTQMKVLFRYQEVSDVIENGSSAGAGTTDALKAATKKKDNKALFLLHQCVDDAFREDSKHKYSQRSVGYTNSLSCRL